MQSELKLCPLCQSKNVTEYDLGGYWEVPQKRGVTTCLDCGCNASTTAWNARASDAEITRLTEALRAAEKLLAEIKGVSDVILAPICAASGRYIYDWAACPDMIEELYSEDVCIPAKAFHDLYMATNYDIVVPAQALVGAKP